MDTKKIVSTTLLENLTDLLTLHEKKERHVYYDSLRVLSIGVGRNVDKKHGGPGLRDCEIDFMLQNDIADSWLEVNSAFPWFMYLSVVRQAVLLDMCHNLGIARLKKFYTTLGHIEKGEYADAAKQMLSSLWARQVGKGYHKDGTPQRALRLSIMMRSNEWPPELFNV